MRPARRVLACGRGVQDDLATASFDTAAQYRTVPHRTYQDRRRYRTMVGVLQFDLRCVAKM